MNFQKHLIGKTCLIIFGILLLQNLQFVLAARFYPVFQTNTSGGSVSSYFPFKSISKDGRFIAFATVYSGIVANDGSNNTVSDVYLVDLLYPTRIKLVSSNSGGSQPANDISDSPSISDVNNGIIKVVFRSNATDLTTTPINTPQIYLREYNISDLSLVNTIVISTTSNGVPGDGSRSLYPRINKNGDKVVFQTNSKLNSNDTDIRDDIYLKDLVAGHLTWVSRKDNLSADSFGPAMSNDGKYVVFTSEKNLTGTGNIGKQVYLWDRDALENQRFEIISVNDSGIPGNLGSGNIQDYQYGSDISDDGKYIVFTSSASNLTLNDTSSDRDIFLRDRSNLANKTTKLISVDPSPPAPPYQEANGVTISDNGKYIMFFGVINAQGYIKIYDNQLDILKTLPSGYQTDYHFEISENGRFSVSSFARDVNSVRPFVYDWVAPAQLNSGDFNSDGFTDLAYQRWANNEGRWWISLSPNYNVSEPTSIKYDYAAVGDKPTPGDYDRDGKTDYAVFRPSDGTWHIIYSSNNTLIQAQFGISIDIPIPLDYDKDDKTDLAVYRPSTSVWYIYKSSTSTAEIVSWGISGDKPVPGDYNGDSKGDIAIFRPNGTNGAEWWVRFDVNGTVTTFATLFGTSTDTPVQSDYTGDGKTDCAFWTPSNGNWSILRSEDFSYYAFPFGTSGDLLTPGDYDNDGKMDAAVFRPSNGTWYLSRSTLGTYVTVFDAAGGKPIPNAFVP
jgi:hypothetical protein